MVGGGQEPEVWATFPRCFRAKQELGPFHALNRSVRP
jgi:hypothetical protein